MNLIIFLINKTVIELEWTLFLAVSNLVFHRRWRRSRLLASRPRVLCVCACATRGRGTLGGRGCRDIGSFRDQAR